MRPGVDMHRMLRFVFLAIVVGASVCAPAARGEVIDRIGVESHDDTATVRLRLTGPVHYVRHFPEEQGELVNVYLEAFSPEEFGELTMIEEAKQSPRDPRIPPFQVRVTVGRACSTAAYPVCVMFRFERPVRYRIRLGDDRRSILLELPLAPPAAPMTAPPQDKP